MLLNLHVKNMALIEETEVDFYQGLNILTGETGAGKSIIIGAVNVALGITGFKDYIRDRELPALAELIFSVDEKQEKALIALGIVPEDGNLIISRKMHKGRSISKINGETVTVSKVKEAAAVLIDIHGQHEPQSLFYRKNHLLILDRFAKEEMETLRVRCQDAFSRLTKAKKALEETSLDDDTRKKEIDFLKYGIHEISRVELVPGEDKELESRFLKMDNARKILEYLTEADELTVSGNDCAQDLVGRAVKCLEMAARLDPDLAGLVELIAQTENLLGDLGFELSRCLQEFDFTEEEYVQTEERLNSINHLKVKYGPDIPSILEVQKKKEEQLNHLMDYEVYQAQAAKAFTKAKLEWKTVADEITAARKRWGKILEAEITQSLKDLNFLDVRFEIRIEPTRRISGSGQDEVSFVISMNPGQPLRPLEEVASGGELSRIMLALKSVLADQDEIGTLIFDEIDTGISGRTAQKVSEKMAVIARSHQIICITHLAQIAAMEDHHYLIEKKTENQNTVTRIRELDEEESAQELGRILGGVEITERILESAKEMKQLARESKAKEV